MALHQGLSVTVESATQSDHIKLPPNGDYVLNFYSEGDFVLDVQQGGGDGAVFSDEYTSPTDKVTIDNTVDGPLSVRVSGGQCYRMDVTTYNSPITMIATHVG